MSNKQRRRKDVTAENVRQMLSSPVYAYGINLVPAERAADAVMQLNRQLAQEMHDTGAAFTLADLDHRFQALLQELEASVDFTREADCPPIIATDLWLQAQLMTIEKLARGETL